MEDKYNQAIKAGIIGGILLVLCSMVSLIIDVINSGNPYAVGVPRPDPGISCLFFVVEMIIVASTGALAVTYARPILHGLSDAIVVAAVAGLVAGFIGGVIQVVIAFIRPFIIKDMIYDLTAYGLPRGILGSLGSGVLSCIGMPFWVLLAFTMAVIGGAIYAALTKHS